MIFTRNEHRTHLFYVLRCWESGCGAEFGWQELARFEIGSPRLPKDCLRRGTTDDVFPFNMKGSLLRQGFRLPHDDLRSPCKLDDGPMKEQGDTGFDRKQKSKAVLVEKDDASSKSCYESSYDTDDETDDDAARAATTSQDDTVPLPRNSPSQPSSNGRESREVHISKAWYEFDLAVMIALASPVGNWLTGGDHVKNLVLIFLLIFYLHQLVEGGLPIFYLGTTSYRQPC